MGEGFPNPLNWLLPVFTAIFANVVLGNTDVKVSILNWLSNEGGKALPYSSIK